MAKSRTTEVKYTNPEVKFERTDIEIGRVVTFSFVLAAVLVVTAVVGQLVAWRFTVGENKVKATALPTAQGDKVAGAGLPPEPRLEAIDDLRDIKTRNLELFPARAENLRKQERPLPDSIPIADAIAQQADKLKTRKEKSAATFGIALPGTASSGRFTTGGVQK